jgi:hypothetical protein
MAGDGPENDGSVRVSVTLLMVAPAGMLAATSKSVKARAMML